MDKIARIRTEIERRIKLYDGNNTQELWIGNTYRAVLSFIDTLSEEPVQKFNTDKLQEIAKPATPHKKPTPEDRAKFMEELHEYAESKKPDKSLEVDLEKEIERYCKKSMWLILGEEGISKCAHHFYELGQSQMPMPEDTVLFQKGVAEGRRLEREDMMKVKVKSDCT